MCRTFKRSISCAVTALCLLACQLTSAQEDLTSPPRIIEDTEPLTPPARPQRSGDIEEIVVISEQNPWRLPDLGSSWRDPLADENDTGRISADVLPIWDPDTQELPTRDPYALGDGFRRVGFIEIFRIRFGRR